MNMFRSSGAGFNGHVVIFRSATPGRRAAQSNVQDRGRRGLGIRLSAHGTESVRVRLPLLGEHNIYNALAGSLSGCEHGIPLKEAAAGVVIAEAVDKRGELWRSAERR